MPTLRGAATLTVTLLLAACTSGADDSESEEPPSPSPSAGRIDVSGLPVPRGDVCAALPADGVEQALAGSVGDTGHYGNGDEVEIVPGHVDVSHEYGCVFAAADRTAARTWIFARPVTRAEAETLVRRARRQRDCAFPDLVGFGTPGLNSVCDTGGAVRTRFEGLFGDTWFGCEVSEPHDSRDEDGPDVVQRAEQWCTEVVTTVGARG